MSSLENQVSSPIFSYTFPIMVAGTISSGALAAATVVGANFFTGTSRVLGLVRTTPSVNPANNSNPYIASIAVTGGGVFPRTVTIVLNSFVNTDTSIYTMYWQNETLNVGQSSSVSGVSSALAVFPC